MVAQISSSCQVRRPAVLVPTITRYVTQALLRLRNGAPIFVIQLEPEGQKVLCDVLLRIDAQPRPHNDGLDSRDIKHPARRHRRDRDPVFLRHDPERRQNALEGIPPASGPDEAEVLPQGPVEDIHVRRLRLTQPLLGDEPAQERPVAEEADAAGHTEVAHPPADGAEVDDRAGDLVGGDLEAGVEQHLEVGRVGVGQAQVGDLALGLEAGQVGEVVDVRVIGIVPDVVCEELVCELTRPGQRGCD